MSATLLTLCALALSACGSEDEAESADAGAATTALVTDAAGTEVEIPAGPKRGAMDLDASLAPGVEPVGPAVGRGRQGAPRYLADQAKSIPVVGAVRDEHATVIAGTERTGLSGAQAAVQVLDDFRKAMVK
ncbi:hypothetical protein ACWD04_30785 [Streptomyces sp. NPDC002911]